MYKAYTLNNKPQYNNSGNNNKKQVHQHSYRSYMYLSEGVYMYVDIV